MTNDEKFDQIKDHLELLSAQLSVLLERAAEEDAEDLEELEEGEDEEEEEGHEWDIDYIDQNGECQILKYDQTASDGGHHWWTCGNMNLKAEVFGGVVSVGSYDDDGDFTVAPFEFYQWVNTLLEGSK